MNRRRFSGVLAQHLGVALGGILLVPMPTLAISLSQRRKLRKFRVRYKEKPKGSIHTTIVEGYNEDDAKRRLRRRHPEAIFLSVDEITK